MNDSEITWKNEPVRKVKRAFQRDYLESILEPIGFQLKIDLNDDYDYAFRFSFLVLIISTQSHQRVSSGKDALSKNRSLSLYLTSKNDGNIR